MKIEPAILGRHLHEAAVEQLANDLRREGYSVELEPRYGNMRPDIVARRGNEAIVYEVKAVGTSSRHRLSDLARVARDLGAKFELVVVRPQRDIDIVMDGIGRILVGTLRQLGPAAYGVREGVLERVSDPVIDQAHIREVTTELSGSVNAIIRAPDGTEEPLEFRFTLRLDPDHNVIGQPKITVEEP